MGLTGTKRLPVVRRLGSALLLRPQVRGVLRSGLSVALIFGSLALLFGSPAGVIFARVAPYLVFPAVALALLATDRGARTMPHLVWLVGGTLLATGVIAAYPTVRILTITISSVGLVVAALVLGTIWLHPRDMTGQRAYAIAAFAVVGAFLLAPITAEIEQLRVIWQREILDVRSGGAVHTNSLSGYGTDYLALMRLIQEKTPEDATIAFPDHYAFSVDGNAGLSYYFLYPRTIKSEGESRTPVFDIAGATYIVGIARNNRNVWPLISVPVRTYYHSVAAHDINFGTTTIRTADGAIEIAPSELRAWQTDADRSVERDVLESDGTRTMRLEVTGSVTDPWVSSVNLPLASNTTISVPVQTNGGTNRALCEQVALLAEVQGPNGETALFTSQPAPQTPDPYVLTLSDLSRRATEYARARGWPAGPLRVTRVGLDVGWQQPLSQTRVNVLAVIERGEDTLPAGPDSYARLARDAQRQQRSGNTSAAIDRYATALLLRPDNLDGQLALGEAFRAAGRWQDGARFFTALLQDHPANPWIRYRLATMQRELGNREAARVTIAPLFYDLPTVRITHPAVATNPAGRARITATQSSSFDAKGYQTTVTLTYDTGDGSVGQVTVATPGGVESPLATGATGTLDISTPGKSPAAIYRLYGGPARATVLDTVTVEYLGRLIPPEYTLWVNLLYAQLTAELGDPAGARQLYQLLAIDPGEFGAMAQMALQQLARGK